MTPPLRVGYVVNMFPKLSETFILEEIAELARRGVECRVLSLKTPTEPVRHPAVETSHVLDRTWYDVAAFAAALTANPPDLVHAHFATEPTRVARALASSLGVPYVFTAHGYDLYRKPPADLRERVEEAAAVVTVSDANADYLACTFGVARARITVLSCGVDLSRFVRAPHACDPHTIVAVARLRPVKNLGLLLRASATLRDRGVPHRIVIVGDGPQELELKAERDARGLQDIVEFAGALTQDGVLAWWQRATVGVLTSLSEGMPVSLMEAAACGVPVVAPHVGGIPELVVHGQTGLVVPPGDVAACADALEAILTSPTTRARMSDAATERAHARFGVARQVDALTNIWSNVAWPAVA